MQVQKIQSNNTNFGYNIQVNKQLMQNLSTAKKNKAYFDVFKSLVNWTNQTEQKVKTAEIENKPQLLDKLLRVFLPIKVVLTDMIDAHFPKLGYKAHEIEAYKEDLKQRNLTEKDDHWINDLVYHMEMEDIEGEGQQYIDENINASAEDMISPSMFMIIRSAMGGAGLGMLGLEQVEDDKEVSKTDETSRTQRIEQNKESAELQERIKLGKEKVRKYEPLTEKEKMGLSSLGGMKELKETLMKKMIIPLKDPIQAKYNEEHYGITRPNGFLFYGPPGTGKTTLVERVSVETGLPLFKMSTDSYGGIYVNEAEMNIGAAFDYVASEATEEKPAILFIDDIDTVAGNRKNPGTHEHKKNELGVWLQRIQEAPKHNIIVVAATNNYDNVDSALQGRLRNQIYAGLPDKESRIDIIKMKLEETDNGKKLASDEKALDRIGDLTASFSIRALEDFANEARERAMIDFYHARDIELKDYEEIIAKPESQSKKVKEQEYKNNASRTPIGFGPKK